MLSKSLNVALKEWAVVQRSLLEQHQIILLRKGGISEESGDFDLRAEQFLIMPTYLHETERKGDLQPCFEDWLVESARGQPDSSIVKFECACVVTDIIKVQDREKLFKLMPQHIWSRQFIDGRYDWEPYKAVSALIVRAYRLEVPVTVPSQRSFGGCRSWIELDSPISTYRAIPAIFDDAAYSRRAELTRKLLSERA